MDRLADQHAAAVASEGAAAGLVVIALRPPPGHGELRQGEIAERALRQQPPQPDRRGTEPMLQYDAEADARRLADPDDALRRRRGALDRLLHDHVLTRRRQPLDEI